MTRTLKRALAAGALSAAVLSSAYAAGLWGNWPVVGTTSPANYPQQITGLENMPMDTNLPSGAQPQSEVATTSQVLQGCYVRETYAVSTTATAADMWTCEKTNLILTGAPSSAVTLTTPTAAAIIAALPSGSAVGYSWTLKIVNQGGTSSGVWTLAAGTNVTLTGNKTSIVAGSRTYLGTWATATTVTLEDIGY